MIKPKKLQPGDTVATVSPSWGCAGDAEVRWKYDLGCARLKELGLNVVSAPNALRGEAWLEAHPEARAQDLMWAFENPDVKGILANIGGNDARLLLPYLSADVIRDNPKIFCGYSDIMTLHLFCRKAGLMTFYGDNLLTTIAEAEGWHPYSRRFFEKVLFDPSPIGEVAPSDDWSWSPNEHTDPTYRKTYVKNPGYARVQGNGVVRGKLFGGHGGIMEIEDESIKPQKADFEGCVFFIEDIPEVCDVPYFTNFFDTLGQNGFLQVMNGIVVGKMCGETDFEPFAEAIRHVVSDTYHLPDLPIMSGLNFGHSSPMMVLPYGAEAELDVDNLRFSILENGVV